MNSGDVASGSAAHSDGQKVDLGEGYNDTNTSNKESNAEPEPLLGSEEEKQPSLPQDIDSDCMK